MTIFYTASDIEELAASGITRLEISEGVMITDVAREMAQELGIELAKPGAMPPAAAPAPGSMARAGSRFNKPQGCQHGPIASQAGSAGRQQGGAVSQLVNIVSQLADRRG